MPKQQKHENDILKNKKKLKAILQQQIPHQKYNPHCI